MKSSLVLLLLGTAVIFSACNTTTPRGDAYTRGEGALRTTKLPWFPIGYPGSHEFTVSGLKERDFPFKLRIDSRKSPSEYVTRTPFASVRLRVEILDYSSRSVLASTAFDLRGWREVGDGEFDVYFWSPGQPALDFRERYRVRVTVLNGSIREWDQARLYLR